MSGSITFFRHGQTRGNERKHFLGIKDEALTQKGEQEVWKGAQFLKGKKFDVLLHGEKRRVKETAEILLKECQIMEVLCDDRIREMNFGIFEGLSAMEIEQRYPIEWAEYLSNWLNYTFLGGENTKAYFEECARHIEELKQRYVHQNIIVVGHKGYILCCLAALRNKDQSRMFEQDIRNAQFVCCDWNGAG